MPSLMATSLRWRTHSARTNFIGLAGLYMTRISGPYGPFILAPAEGKIVFM